MPLPCFIEISNMYTYIFNSNYIKLTFFSISFSVYSLLYLLMTKLYTIHCRHATLRCNKMCKRQSPLEAYDLYPAFEEINSICYTSFAKRASERERERMRERESFHLYRVAYEKHQQKRILLDGDGVYIHVMVLVSR